MRTTRNHEELLLLAAAAKFGRRFTDNDALQPELQTLVYGYLISSAVDEATGFLGEMRKRYRHPHQKLSAAMIRGVLNSMRKLHQDTQSQEVDHEVATDFPDGAYTVVFPDHRVTLRIRTARDSKRRWMSRLIGPANESDYLLVAELFDSGLNLRPTGSPRDLEALRVISGDPLAAAKAYALMSGKCCICSRQLTVPESIAAGIGPVCAGKF